MGSTSPQKALRAAVNWRKLGEQPSLGDTEKGRCRQLTPQRAAGRAKNGASQGMHCNAGLAGHTAGGATAQKNKDQKLWLRAEHKMPHTLGAAYGLA